METLLANVSGKVRRVLQNGREYLIAPLALIVPGVLNGSKGALYYPQSEIQDNPSKWNGVPLTLYHPFDALGNPVSASHPGVAERQYIGVVKNATANGKLRADGIFDVARLQKLAPQVLNALERGQPIELSTGLYTQNEPAKGVDAKGRHYDYIARDYQADHVAVLYDQQGACSIKDGCGVLVNKAEPTINPAWVEDEDIWEKAKAAADKSDPDDYYAVVTTIYKQMGGGIKGNTRNAIEPGNDDQRKAAFARMGEEGGGAGGSGGGKGGGKKAALDKLASLPKKKGMLVEKDQVDHQHKYINTDEHTPWGRDPSRQRWENDSKVETVAIKDLVYPQDTVSRGKVEAMLKKGLDKQGTADAKHGVRVIKHEGKHYLIDGTHRTVAAELSGQKEIKVRTLSINRLEKGAIVTGPTRDLDPTKDRPLEKGKPSYSEKCQHCSSPTGVNPTTGKCVDCGQQNEPTQNERSILQRIASLLGFNKDANAASDIDPTAPAKGLGKGNWSLEKRANHAKALTESAEASSGAALENPSGHEDALKIHQDALYAHIAAYEEARRPNSTKGEPDYSTAGYHKNQADYHESKVRYHGAQALMHKNKVERGEAVAVNYSPDQARDEQGRFGEGSGGNGKGGGGGDGKGGGHTHESLGLPQNPKKMTIQDAGGALAALGHKLGKGESKPHEGKWTTQYEVKMKGGETKTMSASALKDFLYSHVHNRGAAVAINRTVLDTTTLKPGPFREYVATNKKQPPPPPDDEDDKDEDGEAENESSGYSGSINCDRGPKQNMMSYNDAGAASADAGQASMSTGHSDAIGHAGDALGHAKGNKPGKAMKSHLNAAKEHEDEALRLRKDGYHDRAHEHDNAAATHRKAAALHAPNVTNTQGEPPMNREAILNRLGQKGCFCQDSLTALNQLTDRELIVVNAAFTANAKTHELGPDLDFSEGEAEDSEGLDGEDLHSFDGKPRKTKSKQVGGAGTPDEYNENRSMNLNQLPADIREDVRYAREMKNRERGALLERITANAANDEARKALHDVYSRLGLGELRKIVAAMPPPADNALPPNSHTLPLYFGAASPATNVLSSGPREVEDRSPTLNLEEQASQSMLAFLGKKSRSA